MRGCSAARATPHGRATAHKKRRRDTRPSSEPENAPAQAWRTASPPAPPARPRARSSPPPKRTCTHTSRARRGPLGERPRRLGARPERGARRPARPARAARARCGAIFFPSHQVTNDRQIAPAAASSPAADGYSRGRGQNVGRVSTQRLGALHRNIELTARRIGTATSRKRSARCAVACCSMRTGTGHMAHGRHARSHRGGRIPPVPASAFLEVARRLFLTASRSRSATTHLLRARCATLSAGRLRAEERGAHWYHVPALRAAHQCEPCLL